MTIRFIVVGVGVRGTQWSRVLREDPRTAVVAYVDPRVDVARRKANEWGQRGLPCFADIGSALEAVEADVVVLATPPEGHREQCLLAFAHGLHVLCEKPLADELSEAIEIVSAAEDHGVHLMVSMQHRYIPASQAVRRLLQEKRFGEPGYGQYVSIRNRDGRRPDLNKYPLTMKEPLLLEASVHHLDLMRYGYGVEVEAVSADTWRPSWSTYADNCCASVLLRFAGGLRVNYLATWTAGWNGFQFRWRTDCPEGVIIQEDFFGAVRVAKYRPELAMIERHLQQLENTEPLELIPLPDAEDYIDDTRGLLEELVGVLQDRQPMDASGKDHIKTLCLVFAAIEAAETSQWIDMAEFYRRHGVPQAWVS